MTRKQKREIKAAYRDIHGLQAVSDADVFAAYVGSFPSNLHFEAYLNDDLNRELGHDENVGPSADNFDAHGNWTLDHSDMALGVYVCDDHYFWRNP